jgi:hypothetical protein
LTPEDCKAVHDSGTNQVDLLDQGLCVIPMQLQGTERRSARMELKITMTW